MTGLLDMLFGLGAGTVGGLGFGADSTRFEFARALPGWLLVLVLLGCAAGTFLLYRGQLGRGWRRATMVAMRAGALVLLVLVLMGPQLVRDRERVEPDWVVLLVDRSASNTVPDAPGGRTRDAQLRATIETHRDTLGSLSGTRRVLWLGFDAGLRDLSPDGSTGVAGAARDSDAVPELPEADGRATRLGAALRGALDRLAGRPVAGVVLLSDGRSADAIGEAAWQRLESDRIPVFAVPLGDERPVRDASARAVEAPGVGFLGDTVPVRVEAMLRGLGGPAGPDAADGSSSAGDTPPVPPAGVVRIEDAATGRELARMPLQGGTLDADGRLTVTVPVTPTPELTPVGPEGAVDAVWRVVIDAEDDLIGDNNTQLHEIRLVDRPIRVAYFDGYPRWENRYLKNLLLREASIESAGVLLSSSRSYLQEGDVVLDSLPTSPEEWAAFDVIILGDLRSGLLSDQQHEQLRDLVATRGVGLLWMAGPGATPASWYETALGDLIPIRAPGSADPGASGRDAPSFVTARTELAERLGMFDLAGAGRGWPPTLADPGTGWSTLRWSVPVAPDRVKPAAEVLVEARDLDARGRASLAGRPLVLGMRYGLGRVYFVGTDEIWRWRYGRGEDLPERFWLPMVRSLARESLGRTGASSVFTATPTRVRLGAGVGLRLRLADQALIDAGLRDPRVEVRLDTGSGDDASSPTLGSLRLTPDQAPGEPTVSLTGSWTPSDPGRYRLRVVHPLLVSSTPEAVVTVIAPDDELANPDSDHDLLRTLTERTGGRMLTTSGAGASPATDAAQPGLGDLPGLLPNRARVLTMTPETATLWDRPVVFAVFLLMLGLEWVLRRLSRLD